MAEWLILRMPRAANAAAGWLAADSEGRPLSAVQSGSLELAASAANGRRVAVLVHAAEVLSLEIELPARSAARAAQLVPFALEEQLATDIEAQHFAIGRSDADGRTTVAVVTRALLEDWLAQLAAADIKPDLLCADADLLPQIAGHTVALLEGDTLSLMAGDSGTRRTATVISAPPGAFAGALAVACGEAAVSTHLLFHVTPLEWQRRSSEIEAARPLLASLRVQVLSSGALPWLAARLPAAAPINLMQGAYAQRRSLGTGWARWRLAAALTGALLLLHLGSQAYSLWRLNRAERELDGAIAQLAGPQLSAGSGSIRQRLEQSLRASGAQDGKSGLLPALQVLAQAMRAVAGTRIQALDFHDGALQLKLRAGDAQSLDRVNQTLRSAGWHAELISGGAAGDAYEGNIELRGSAS